MLTQVRSVLKGAVAWVVIILLIAAFALWQVPQISSLSGNAAVTVGDKRYSPQYVQSEFNRVVNVQRAESGGAFTPEDALASGLDQQILSSIIRASAIDSYADRMNLVVPREQIRKYLQNEPNFKNPATGRFDRMILTRALREFGMTAGEFEQRVAEDFRRQQLLEALVTRAPAPASLIDYTVLRETERRRIKYITVTEEMAGKAEEPTPDDLQSYYAANSPSFMQPEYRSFDVVYLRNEDFRNQSSAPEEELRRIYEVNKPRLYEKPELRTVRQLTFSSEAEARAARIQLQQGTSFEDLASQQGFTLDAVTKSDARQNDILDPSVGAALFADDMDPQGVTEPISTLFGFTIAQVVSITPPELTTFEEVRDEIENDYLNQGTRRALLDAVDQIEEIRDTGASLRNAAEEAGFDIVSVEPVDRFSFAPGGAIIPDIPGEVLAEVFAMEEGAESEAETLTDESGYYFAAVREIREPVLTPYEDVAEEVEQRWRKDERNRRIEGTVRALRDEISNGLTIEDAASQLDRAPITLVIDRAFENEVISRAFNEQIFYAEPGTVVSSPAALGEASILVVIDEIAVSPNAFPAEQRSLYQQYLGYQIDQELADVFVESVVDDFKVTTNEDRLNQAFGRVQ